MKVRTEQDGKHAEANCLEGCWSWFYDSTGTGAAMAVVQAFSVSELRTAARQHTASTGHPVEVTVEGVTRYEPEGNDR